METLKIVNTLYILTFIIHSLPNDISSICNKSKTRLGICKSSASRCQIYGHKFIDKEKPYSDFPHHQTDQKAVYFGV